MLQHSEVQDDPSVQLHIIIVGAGIAGFAVAAALRQAGHKITIIEKSTFTKEAGFSISVAPNGAKVLNALGFDFSKAGAVHCNAIVDRDSKTLEPRINFSTRDAVKRWGAPWVMILRPDIHNELKRVALQYDGRTPVPELVLGARVTSVDIDLATVILEDGTIYSGDLLIGADGERSLIQQAVIDSPGILRGSPVSIFRNIVPTEVMTADPITRRIMESRRNTFTMFSNKNSYTILTWFECRNGTLQDLEASYVNVLPDGTKKVFDKAKLKDAMLHEFRDFHPDLVHTLKKVTEATDWQINFARPLSNWVKSRAALVGDAAHSMFPTTGQGGCQSIEDAGALGVLLSNIRHKDELPERLRLYESIRRQRASTSQAMSSTVFGREHEVPERMHKYLPGGMPFRSAEQYQEYTNSYDVMAECRRALRRAQRSQTQSHL